MEYVTVNDRVATRVTPATEPFDEPQCLRVARYCALEEASVLLFGTLTIAWIVLSLVRLAS